MGADLWLVHVANCQTITNAGARSPVLFFGEFKMKTSYDVVREVNRKLTASILENPTRAHTRATPDDVLCAIVFVAFVAFVCWL